MFNKNRKQKLEGIASHLFNESQREKIKNTLLKIHELTKTGDPIADFCLSAKEYDKYAKVIYNNVSKLYKILKENENESVIFITKTWAVRCFDDYDDLYEILYFGCVKEPYLEFDENMVEIITENTMEIRTENCEIKNIKTIDRLRFPPEVFYPHDYLFWWESERLIPLNERIIAGNKEVMKYIGKNLVNGFKKISEKLREIGAEHRINELEKFQEGYAKK